jgi:hypothetical protein
MPYKALEVQVCRSVVTSFNKAAALQSQQKTLEHVIAKTTEQQEAQKSTS